MKLRAHHPMALELRDFIGLRTALLVKNVETDGLERETNRGFRATRPFGRSTDNSMIR